ncbi:cytochrome P450 [Microbispora sp. NEAU-D428]|uniref:cytochrome P450 family protein n=1 Tax=Microbispora sitophila TaxID=2771537 RepID=UPI001868DD3F|nr:cytochrome P450 [Microbispora sitophila]MBE3016049.1 cytochrome P450 [Microbispora sitophila]
MRGPSPALYSPEFFQNPYPTWAWLRENDPVHQFAFPGTDVPVWLVTRYADVLALLADPRVSSNPDNADQRFKEAGLGFSALGMVPGLSDPPDHTRLRRLAMKAFTPRNVEIWRTFVRDTVHSLLDKAEARGETDVVQDFAGVLTAEVTGQILGMKPDLRQDLAEHMNGVLSNVPERVQESGKWLLDNAREVVAFKRTHPGDDLTSRLIAARDGADRLSEEELVAWVSALIFGGHDTTKNLIGNATLALLDHPDQFALLRDDLSITPQAVEEFLRYESPVTMSSWRFVTSDLKVAGVELPVGAAVLPATLSANHDPDRFPDPDRLDLSRTDVRHLAFAHGVHNCIGAALARMEAQIAMSALVGRFPELTLAVPRSDLRYRAIMFARQLESLPVRLSR